MGSIDELWWQSYPPHEGKHDLIEDVRRLIKLNTGKTFNHILITNGATHGICTALNTLKETTGYKDVFFKKPHFAFYPGMVKAAGLDLTSYPDVDRAIHLIDSPSNPLGEFRSMPENDALVVWDAVYHTPTYTHGIYMLGNYVLDANILVGSFSKLTGVNGVRVGFLATHSPILYQSAYEYVTHTLCGVDAGAQDFCHKFMTDVDLDVFYEKSNKLIQNNKNELERIAYLFGQKIPDYGMFAMFETDAKLLKLFEKSSVKFMSGESVGAGAEFVRINLAKTNIETKNMVKAILSKDKI
jgi:aspartate/methionine/tyrosine aminotransferase